MDPEDFANATPLRVSLITGTVALGAATITGLIMSAVLYRWQNVLPALVPASMSAAAIGSGPRGSVGRRLGWISFGVLLVGIAAGLIFHATSDSFSG